jgi:predicted methyltransferase
MRGGLVRAGGLAAALLLIALGGCRTTAPAPSSSASISEAVADPDRPAADRQRDASRHPAELMAFAGVRPGWKVADFMPGSGYFTRIFAKIVGPTGHVHAVFPEFLAQFDKRDADAVRTLAAAPAYANVSFETTPNDQFKAAEPLDLVWTSDNYHDLLFGLDHGQILALDRQIFEALKPGGVLIVVDHASAPGAGWSVAKTLHRIDPEAIKADMAAAGFRLEAQSAVLHDPKDPHTAVIFDPSIRGRTDQVVLRFRKPG